MLFSAVRYQVSGVRYQVSGVRYQVSGHYKRIHAFTHSPIHAFNYNLITLTSTFLKCIKTCSLYQRFRNPEFEIRNPKSCINTHGPSK
jgi:IS4 transposase